MKYTLILLTSFALFCCEKKSYNHIIELEVTYVSGYVCKIVTGLYNVPEKIPQPYYYIKDTCLFRQGGHFPIECGIVMFVVTSHTIEEF